MTGKAEEATGASSQALQWVFWVFGCFHLVLPLLLGSVCFPLPNQPKLPSGASVPVTPQAGQILVSDPHQPFSCAPANSTFLSLLQAQRMSKEWGQEGTPALSTCFFPKNWLIFLPPAFLREARNTP